MLRKYINDPYDPTARAASAVRAFFDAALAVSRDISLAICGKMCYNL